MDWQAILTKIFEPTPEPAALEQPAEFAPVLNAAKAYGAGLPTVILMAEPTRFTGRYNPNSDTVYVASAFLTAFGEVRDRPMAKRVKTLAHELGHYLALHTQKVGDEANWASEALADEIGARLLAQA